ncbi:hypothetical protein Trydic_g21012 [Trypoxylus dichotomus]
MTHKKDYYPNDKARHGKCTSAILYRNYLIVGEYRTFNAGRLGVEENLLASSLAGMRVPDDCRILLT